MVRFFSPQGRNSSLESNTNFPPQSGPISGPPIGKGTALVQTGTLTALVQTGTLTALVQTEVVP